MQAYDRALNTIQNLKEVLILTHTIKILYNQFDWTYTRVKQKKMSLLKLGRKSKAQLHSPFLNKVQELWICDL